MRKLIVLSFITLDGVMQAPGGPEEDPTGGFSYGGWTGSYWDEAMVSAMDEQMAGPFELLLGRKTYEIFAAHWPYVKNDPDKLNQRFADKMNDARKYVVSKTLKEPAWQNTTVISGDVAQEIGKLKELDGPDIQVHGSSGLIQTLLRHDLVDEFWLKIFPVTLGTGKRLFGEGAIAAGFKLLQSRASTTGVIIANYVRAGDVTVGSFMLENPTEAELARRRRMKEEG